MKQRVRVAAVIKNNEKILFLRRASGRSEEQSRYELPTSKIIFGEQPEDSIVRATHEQLGVSMETIRLYDVITFINTRDSSQLSNLYIVFELVLGPGKIVLNSDRYTSYKWLNVSELSAISLDEASKSIIDIIDNSPSNYTPESIPAAHDAEAIVYTDGGSRGNPGPSAAGYYIVNPDGSEIAKGGEFLGITNSRQAEYIALKVGIEKILSLGFTSVKFYLDNLMVVSQLNGAYIVKNRDIWPIYDDIKKLLVSLKSYSFHHIKRGLNYRADAEVNKILDQNGHLW